MTRKHFIAIAEALADVKPAMDKGEQYNQWFTCVVEIARVCDQFNVNFDIERFIKACKGENLCRRQPENF